MPADRGRSATATAGVGVTGWVGTQAETLRALTRDHPGLRDGWLSTARPLRRVTLRPYRLDRRLVTNADFAAFVDARGYAEPDLWSAAGRDWLARSRRAVPKFWGSSRWSRWCEPDHPVVGVTWYEAEAYAAFRGRRLPDEDEWEVCARGGTQRAYPWGDGFRLGLANTAEHWLGELITDVDRWHHALIAARPWRTTCMTTPVGHFPAGAGPLGHADLAGNVWEWCRTAAPDGRRVVRGGSFAYLAWNARADERGLHPPWWAALGIGFRCAEDEP
jgi:formylglycine-generating enzyme required for sulfatase activity